MSAIFVNEAAKSKTLTIRTATLIFGADQDLSFPGAVLLARAKVLFPRAELELLSACKHCPPFTSSFREQLAERIHTFLAAPPAALD